MLSIDQWVVQICWLTELKDGRRQPRRPAGDQLIARAQRAHRRVYAVHTDYRHTCVVVTAQGAAVAATNLADRSLHGKDNCMS
jgi:hypothetical protein